MTLLFVPRARRALRALVTMPTTSRSRREACARANEYVFVLFASRLRRFVHRSKQVRTCYWCFPCASPHFCHLGNKKGNNEPATPDTTSVISSRRRCAALELPNQLAFSSLRSISCGLVGYYDSPALDWTVVASAFRKT